MKTDRIYEELTKIVDTQLNDKDYDIKVKKYLDKGLNYPTAMAKSLDISINFNNKIKVYAFVGPSGTGKSYRAQMVARICGYIGL